MIYAIYSVNILVVYGVNTGFGKFAKIVIPSDKLRFVWMNYLLCTKMCSFRSEKVLPPAGIYLFKVNNRNTRTMCETCPKLAIKTPKRCHWRCSGVFIVNLEQISHIVLVFLLLTLNKQMPAGICLCSYLFQLRKQRR